MRLNSIVILALAVLLGSPTLGVNESYLSNNSDSETVIVQEVEENSDLINSSGNVNLKESLFKEYVPQLLEEPKKEIDIDNIVYIGNSLVEGLRLNSGANNPFLAKVGISLEGLKSKHYGLLNQYDCETVVIGMGTNELGSYSKEKFINSYMDLVNHIRSINPNSNIICMTIPPVTVNKSNSNNYFNNNNVEIYNRYIKELCEQNNLIFLDNEPFFGKVLNNSWSGDGIHLKGNIYKDWYEYIVSEIEKF